MSKWEDPEKCGWNEAALRAALEHAERALKGWQEARDVQVRALQELGLLGSPVEELRRLSTRLAEADKSVEAWAAKFTEMQAIAEDRWRLMAEAEQRGRALLAVARAVHPIFSKTANEYGACGICHRITHPAGCDCPIAALNVAYPDWRAEWRHGRPHDARMAEDHDEA